MKRALIATIDAARARLFLYQEQAKPGFELIEYKDLDNPGRRLRPSEMFSDSHPGVRGAPGNLNMGGPGDDHRGAHIEEMDSKFAKHVLEAIQHVLADKKMGHLILVAAPKMPGILRAEGRSVLGKTGLVCDEIARDLSGLPPAQPPDHLSQIGPVPPRPRPPHAPVPPRPPPVVAPPRPPAPHPQRPPAPHAHRARRGLARPGRGSGRAGWRRRTRRCDAAARTHRCTCKCASVRARLCLVTSLCRAHRCAPAHEIYVPEAGASARYLAAFPRQGTCL